jgi:hypothetical protein
MTYELHIEIRPGVTDPPEELLADFSFEPGQSILTFANGVIIIDMGDVEDTTTAQEWYLNNHEDVQSFYVVEDD